MQFESLPRIPIADTEPNFGYPSKPAWEAAIQELERRTEPSAETNATFAQWHLAATNKERYHRIDTAIIPDRMLKPGQPMTMDDIYAMLNVYYWWDEESIIPNAELEDLLIDLDDVRFVEATRLLHAEFAWYCDYAPKYKPCRKDGQKCLEKYTRKHGSEDKREVVESLELLIDGIFDEQDGYDSSPLFRGLLMYNRRILGSVGLSELEIGDQENVFTKEQGRRGFLNFSYVKDHPYNLYQQAREDGMDHDEFIRKELATILASRPGQFESITKEFEDLPANVMDWDIQTKIALTRRYLESNPSYNDLFRITYDWETYGIVLPYLYRFRPDDVFPGEI